MEDAASLSAGGPKGGAGVESGKGELSQPPPASQRRSKRGSPHCRKELEFEAYYDSRPPSHTAPKSSSPSGKPRFSELENEEEGPQGFRHRKSEDLSRGGEVQDKGRRTALPRSQSTSPHPNHNPTDGPSADVSAGPSSPLRLSSSTRMASIGENASRWRDPVYAHPSLPPQSDTQPKELAPAHRRMHLPRTIGTDNPSSPQLLPRVNAAREASGQFRRSASIGAEEVNGAVVRGHRRSQSACQVASQPGGLAGASGVLMGGRGGARSQSMDLITDRFWIEQLSQSCQLTQPCVFSSVGQVSGS